jgi:hypothetical protein
MAEVERTQYKERMEKDDQLNCLPKQAHDGNEGILK